MSSHALVLFGIAIPVIFLFAGSSVLLSKRRSLPSWLQLVGSAGLMTVVGAHIAEAFHLVPWMGWGLEDSAGHYLDLGSAFVGFILFPIGYLADALAQ